MIDNLDMKRCTGCFACVQKCPKKCIQIIKDEEGFYVPNIRKEDCVGCNLCEVVCPQMNPVTLHKCEKAYAAKMKDVNVLKTSTSGGVFATAAINILERGGVVFGVEMTAEGIVQTTFIESRNELYRLQGSKYVQSYIGDSYIKAQDFLRQGRKVLFSGTPCQIAGLRSYLGKEYDNLFTIDLICHGVPSQELFSAYRKWLEKKNRKKIINWNFRNKEKEGWSSIDKITYDGKIVFQGEYLNHYTRAFLKGFINRESCYGCLYAKEQRIGDITVGDYWGIRQFHPQFYSPDGVSAMLINTKQGEKLMEHIFDKIQVIESRLEWMQRFNGNLKCPTARSMKRDDVYKNLYIKDMKDYLKSDLKVGFVPKEMIRNCVPYSIRQRVKEVLGIFKVR